MLESASKEPLTDVQHAIERFPNVDDGADRVVKVPCRLQAALFYTAFADASSQERQLRRLADHIRRRFSDDWLIPAEVAAPAVSQGAKRLAGLLARTSRLERKGMGLPDDIRNPVQEGSFKARILGLSDDAVYAADLRP